jgi:organic radical activating enzyme
VSERAMGTNKNHLKMFSKFDLHSDLIPYYEIETNGTVVIDQSLFNTLDQINCSPKLSNSGMTAKQRINPEAIERIKQHSNYQFKFVISNEEDVQELFRDFIIPFSIPLKNVVCMPGLDSQTDFHERTQFVLEMAKKYKFRGLTRLHISAWDKTLNV